MPGTFVYTPAAGTVLSAGAAQTLSVTFTPTDAANYTTATTTVAINVLKATPTITWATPADIVYGTALSATQLERDGDCAGHLRLQPAAGTVLTAGAAQTLSVTFTPTDAANYTTATDDGRRSPSQGDADDHLGDAGGYHLRHGAQRDAAERDRRPCRARFVYTPGGRHVLDAGAAQTLSVTFTPTDAANYTTATGRSRSPSPRRRRRSPGRRPADIIYGTALSATQLNATARCPAPSSTRRRPARCCRPGGADAVGDLHADRHGELHDRHRERRRSPSLQGDADDHLADAGRHHLRHGAQRDAAERDGDGARAPSSTRRRPATVLRRRGADAVGDLHADRRGQLHRRRRRPSRSPSCKATPTITWATPADIIYGTALSATQLNATATVPGTFVYTPAAGTVLSRRGADAVGDLHADRRGELHDATDDVAITVLKATPTITWATPADIVYGTALERDAAERDGERARHVRLHARPPARC